MEWLGKAKTGAVESATKLYDGIKEWLGKVPELISSAWDSVLTYLTDIPGKIYDKLKKIGAAGLSGYKDGSDTHSPSGIEKLFFAMGDNITAKLEKLIGEHGAKSKAHGKAVLDGFKSGVTGLEAAFDFLGDKLGSNFDKMISILTPKVSKGADQIKQAFQQSLGDINKWLASTGGVGLSPEALILLMRNYPKVAAEMAKMADEAKLLNDAMSHYGALMSVASGRNTEFAQTVDGAIKKLLEADKSLRENITPSMANLNNTISETIAITKEMGDAIARSVGSLAKATIDSSSLDTMLEAIVKTAKAAKQAKEDIVDSLGKGIGGALNSLADQFGWHLGKVQGWSKDVGNIIDTMPGKFGDAVRKVSSTLNQWLSFGNSVLSILNKVFGDGISSSVGGLLSSIVGLFKGDKATNQVGGAISTMVNSATQSAAGAATAAGQAAGGAVTGGVASGITGGIGAATSALGGMFSALTQAVSVFASTFHDDSKSVRFAGGFLVGGVIGGTLAAIFGGPSDFEKAKRELQLDQIKANIASVYEDMKSKMVDVMAKGQQLLEAISVRTDTPRKAIRRFINQLGLMLELFIDESKRLAPMAMDAAKAVTENLGGAFDFMLGAVGLSKAIKGMEEATDTDVKALGASTTKLLNAIFAVMADVELSIAKQSGKKSDRLKPVIDFVTAIPNAIKAAIETPEISLDQVAAAFGNARKFIDGFFKFSEDLIGYALNKASKAGGQLGGIFETGKSMFEFLGGFANYKPLEGNAFDGINSDVNRITTWMGSLVEMTATWGTMSDTVLGNVNRWADGLAKTASAIKAAVSGGVSASGAITANIQSQNGAAFVRSGNSGSGGQSVVNHNYYGDVNNTIPVKEITEILKLSNAVEVLQQRINSIQSPTGGYAQSRAGY